MAVSCLYVVNVELKKRHFFLSIFTSESVT